MSATETREGSETAMVNRTSVERSSDRELTITRTFNAPPRIVFDAWTNADLVKRWWAPVSLGVSIVSCEADVRVGGRYRYVLKPAKSDAIAFSGTYREVTPHSRLVYTSFFEPALVAPEDESEAAVVTVTFEADGAKTRLVARELYPSKEVLDGAIATGMEVGLRETMDLLGELVETLR
jgi:uncharacterized protein YndB with AHSA1/START domain